jgi:signal transduction histidine kinase
MSRRSVSEDHAITQYSADVPGDLERQREKLAALGKLSAGLAHEMNNPASAVLRSVQQLQANLTVERALYRELTSAWTDSGARRTVEEWIETIEARAQASSNNAVDRSEREDRLERWLDTRNPGLRAVSLQSGADPMLWKLVPALADAGVEPADLDKLEAGIGPLDIATVLQWAAAALTVDSMVRTAKQSANRVTELVAAIKSYTHVDEASFQEVDLHEGLESVVTMLRGKLAGKVCILRSYDRTLPAIAACGGELTQVWMNLIDNAIDAVEGQGTIVLRTAREAEYALVEVVDDGPGIPESVLPFIYEPFFTTKGADKGTGLGLEISYRIVVDHHHGDIRVVSVPGETRFQVRLPIRQPPSHSGDGFMAT